MFESDNPYSSPTTIDAGTYDHGLFWTFVKVCLLIAAAMIVLDAINLTFGELSRPDMLPGDALIEEIKNELVRLGLTS